KCSFYVSAIQHRLEPKTIIQEYLLVFQFISRFQMVQMVMVVFFGMLKPLLAEALPKIWIGFIDAFGRFQRNFDFNGLIHSATTSYWRTFGTIPANALSG